jgi:arylsulfatase A-like enzyme
MGLTRAAAISQAVQNVDLYPTFVRLAGRTPVATVDGHSLVPLLHPKVGGGYLADRCPDRASRTQ